MKAQLIVVQGKPEGKVIPLATPIYKIGRGENCNLRPNSDLVSREHVEFSVTATQVIVRDLGSRNGTLVNGKTITDPYTLKDRDLITVGTLTFAISIQDVQVVASGKPANAPSASAPARTGSPDDVSHDDIESWLVADNARPQPERPSGVYSGDTMTIETFKLPAAPAPEAKAPAPAPSKPATVAAAPAPPKPAPAVAPTPAPAKPAAAPVIPAAATAPPVPAPAPAPVVPQPVAAAPVPAPAPAPAPVPTPVAAAPAPAPARPAPSSRPAPAATPPQTFDDFEFERLPEGVGDANPDDDHEDRDVEDGEEGDEDMVIDEYVDESNPFYVKKAKEEEVVVKGKPVFKDSSDAATDILRKMMERRRR